MTKESCADADDTSLRDARAWMRAAPVAVCVNARFNVAPVEMAAFEAAYCLMTYTVAKTDTLRDDAEMYAEDAGSAVLWRQFPVRAPPAFDRGVAASGLCALPGWASGWWWWWWCSPRRVARLSIRRERPSGW